MEERIIERDGHSIYGRLFAPEGAGKLPLVILSHGFGGSGRDLEDYAEAFAENQIAAFTFDFVGGGPDSRSGGDMQHMSVQTEAEDLHVVLDFFRNDDRIDQDHILLFGASQGGFVSTEVAATRPEDVAGLILLYPAYVLQDDSRKRNPDLKDDSAVLNIHGHQVGLIYDRDARMWDIYDRMKRYPGKVLIFHGTADPIVPVAYSERAVQAFPDARLVQIRGAGHGFQGEERKTASQGAVTFAKRILAGPGTAENRRRRRITAVDDAVRNEIMYLGLKTSYKELDKVAEYSDVFECLEEHLQEHGIDLTAPYDPETDYHAPIEDTVHDIQGLRQAAKDADDAYEKNVIDSAWNEVIRGSSYVDMIRTDLRLHIPVYFDQFEL